MSYERDVGDQFFPPPAWALRDSYAAEVLRRGASKPDAAQAVFDAFGGFMLAPRTKTRATLPPASSEPGAAYRLSDVNGIWVFSDGLIWMPISGRALFDTSGAQGSLFTGTTSEQDAAAWTIPGNWLGTKGGIDAYFKVSANASTNVKYARVYYGGARIGDFQIAAGTSNTLMQFGVSFRNRGVKNSQIGGRDNTTGYGANTGLFNVMSVDSSVDQTLSLKFWTPSATTDSMRVEEFTIDLVTQG